MLPLLERDTVLVMNPVFKLPDDGVVLDVKDAELVLSVPVV